MKVARGTTIAETLVVAMILGMLLTAVAGAMAPLLAAPNRAQAKADSIAAAAPGFYLLQRDLRQSDVNAIFACVGRPAACGDGGITAADSAVALVTALPSDDLRAQFRTNGGEPNAGMPDWQGFIVYWQAVPGGPVYRSFEPASGLARWLDVRPVDRVELQALATAAVTEATSQPTTSIALRGVTAFAARVDPNAGVTSLHVVASGSAGGHSNTTSFDDDIFARN